MSYLAGVVARARGELGGRLRPRPRSRFEHIGTAPGPGGRDDVVADADDRSSSDAASTTRSHASARVPPAAERPTAEQPTAKRLRVAGANEHTRLAPTGGLASALPPIVAPRSSSPDETLRGGPRWQDDRPSIASHGTDSSRGGAAPPAHRIAPGPDAILEQPAIHTAPLRHPARTNSLDIPQLLVFSDAAGARSSVPHDVPPIASEPAALDGPASGPLRSSVPNRRTLAGWRGAAPTIEVTIGRVEVRAAIDDNRPPAAPAGPPPARSHAGPRPRPAPPVSLDRFLEQRREQR